MNWTYDGGDPSLILFTTAVQRFGLTLPERAVVAELGCAETDWLERMQDQNPTLKLTGVDTRWHAHTQGYEPVRIVGNALDPNLFAPQSLDAVVMLGALEHFGLGFYGDPMDEDGDTTTMRNVAQWLKPGGWVYADVPCNPSYAVTDNRHFRIYGYGDYTMRLVMPLWEKGFKGPEAFVTSSQPEIGQGVDAWPEKPAHPYHYCAFHAVKSDDRQ